MCLIPNKITKVIKRYKAKLLNVVEVILTGFEGGIILGWAGFFGSPESDSPQPTTFLMVPHPSEKTIIVQHR